MCYLGSQTCLNGGVCKCSTCFNQKIREITVSLVSNGRCSCPAGQYQGNYCEYPICQNGAELNEYQCICGPTRAGKLCEMGRFLVRKIKDLDGISETCNSLNYMETTDPRETDYQQVTSSCWFRICINYRSPLSSIRTLTNC